MKNRYKYAILFGVPGLFLAAVAAFFFFGALAGLLWIFVLGDDPWPAWTDVFLPLVLFLAFLALWLITVAAGFAFGRKHENETEIDRRHLLIAAAATLLPILLILLHQLRVGNIGPASDSIRCSDFCRDRGFAGSGMPPQDSGDRSCLCYDPSGKEVLKMPLDKLNP